jgi:hypothetical protein
MVRAKSVLWWPEALHAVAAEPEGLADFAYVVVEEIVDHRLELMSWRWPWADTSGRLFWQTGDDLEPLTATVDDDLLRYQLYRPSRLRRVPRLGDVFAAAGLGPGWGEPVPVGDVRTLFEGPVFDISPDAREAAKLAYQGAVSPVRPPSAADDTDRALLSKAGDARARLKARPLTISPPPAASRRAAR